MRNKNKEGPNANLLPTVVRTIEPILDRAKNIVVKDNATLVEATELLSSMNHKLDIIIIDKETFTAPAHAILKAARMKYKPYEDALNASISDLRAHLTEYATLTKKREEEAISALAARTQPGKGNLSVETALKRMESVDKLVDKVETTIGSITFRPHEELVIISEKDIPREYFDLSRARLLEALKQGKQVSGAKITIIQLPVNRRK